MVFLACLYCVEIESLFRKKKCALAGIYAIPEIF